MIGSRPSFPAGFQHRADLAAPSVRREERRPLGGREPETARPASASRRLSSASSSRASLRHEITTQCWKLAGRVRSRPAPTYLRHQIDQHPSDRIAALCEPRPEPIEQPRAHRRWRDQAHALELAHRLRAGRGSTPCSRESPADRLRPSAATRAAPSGTACVEAGARLTTRSTPCLTRRSRTDRTDTCARRSTTSSRRAVIASRWRPPRSPQAHGRTDRGTPRRAARFPARDTPPSSGRCRTRRGSTVRRSFADKGPSARRATRGCRINSAAAATAVISSAAAIGSGSVGLTPTSRDETTRAPASVTGMPIVNQDPPQRSRGVPDIAEERVDHFACRFCHERRTRAAASAYFPPPLFTDAGKTTRARLARLSREERRMSACPEDTMKPAGSDVKLTYDDFLQFPTMGAQSCDGASDARQYSEVQPGSREPAWCFAVLEHASHRQLYAPFESLRKSS